MYVEIVFLLAASSFITVNSQDSNDINGIFLPYGDAAGDTRGARRDDGYDEVDIGVRFLFFGVGHTKLYVNTNGGMTFTGRYSGNNNSPFPIPNNDDPIIAPWYADCRSDKENSQIYFRETTDQAILDIIDQEIQAASCINFYFEAKWAFVITWWEMTFFGANDEGKTKLNTFQLVLVLDVTEQHSFAIMNFGRLDWTNKGGDRSTGLGGTPPAVGFDAADGENFYSLPGSRTDDTLLLNNRSNIGIPGKWMFKIDTTVKGKLYKCLLFFVYVSSA